MQKVLARCSAFSSGHLCRDRIKLLVSYPAITDRTYPFPYSRDAGPPL